VVATMIRHLGKSSRVDKLPQKMDTDLQQPGLSDARQKHIRARKRVGDFLKIWEDERGHSLHNLLISAWGGSDLATATLKAPNEEGWEQWKYW